MSLSVNSNVAPKAVKDILQGQRVDWLPFRAYRIIYLP